MKGWQTVQDGEGVFAIRIDGEVRSRREAEETYTAALFLSMTPRERAEAKAGMEPRELALLDSLLRKTLDV